MPVTVCVLRAATHIALMRRGYDSGNATGQGRPGGMPMSWSTRNALTAVLAAFAAFLIFATGFVVGHVVVLPGFFLPTIPGLPFLSAPAGAGTPAGLQTTFAPFWQAWSIVHQEYVDQPVNDVTLAQGAIRGMLDAVGD